MATTAILVSVSDMAKRVQLDRILRCVPTDGAEVTRIFLLCTWVYGCMRLIDNGRRKDLHEQAVRC